MISSRRLAAGLLGLSLLVGPAASVAVSAATTAPPSFAIRTATATLRNAAGAPAGWAFFVDAGRGVQVTAFAYGLTVGLHGLHIHTVGSCVAPDFTSAGAHFNPLGVVHGGHGGDLPNLPIGPGGVGALVATSHAFTLGPGPLSIFGGDNSALVVHAGQDDYVTNPTGNSGARIACGLIAPIGI